GGTPGRAVEETRGRQRPAPAPGGHEIAREGEVKAAGVEESHRQSPVAARRRACSRAWACMKSTHPSRRCRSYRERSVGGERPRAAAMAWWASLCLSKLSTKSS